MQEADYLIIGGGIAGTEAAETIRRRDPDGRIVIVSGELHRLYSRTLLSKLELYGGDYDAERLFIKSPKWYEEQKIELSLGKHAIQHNPHRREVRFDNDEVFEYGRLLLALGVTPEVPDVPGAKKGEVMSLQTMDDAIELRGAIGNGRRILVLGKGLIAFEVAWIAISSGSDVTVANRYEYPFFGTASHEQGEIIAHAMTASGVRIIHGAELKEFIGGDGSRGAVFADGIVIPAEIIVAGVGIGTPSAWLYRVDRVADGALLVDKTLRTNVPDVWAAGDCAVLRDTFERTKNWNASRLMGSIAGENMTGGEAEYLNIPMFKAQGFGVDIAFIGMVREMDGVEIEFIKIDDGSSVRRFSKGGALVGAVVLNSSKDIEKLKEEIRSS